MFFLFFFISQPVIGQASQIALFWQDKPLESLGPQIKQGNIYIPIKVMENAGASIYINDSEVLINYQSEDHLFSLESNGDLLEKFGNEYYLSAEAFSSRFNLDIQWNSAEKTIFISEKGLKRTVLGLDFNDSQDRAILTILHQGTAEYEVTKLEPGKLKVDLFKTTLEKPLGILLIDHPLLYSVRAEQLSRDQVTFYIQGKEGLEFESRLVGDDLVLEFFYTVERFEYRSIGGLPLLFYESKTGLPEYREYLEGDLTLVREFTGVKLMGKAIKENIDDDLIDYFEYYQEGPRVYSLIKLKPKLADFFASSVQGKRLAQLSKITSRQNDLGTELIFDVIGSPYYKTKKEGKRLIIDFEDVQVNNMVRDITYSSEYNGLTVTKLTGDSIRVEILLKDCSGYALSKKDEYTYSVQLVKRDLSSKLIILDPGHGGYDPGTVGAFLEEKDLNLDVALRLRDLLVDFGYKAILTRETDLYVSLSERTNLSLSSGADLFVSIHTNGSLNQLANGIETFYAPRNSEGKELAEYIQRALLVQTKALDRTAKEANFWVLVNNVPCSVLVEIGFVTNAPEEERLSQSHYRQKVADGICSGIIGFLN
ncbi:MAG: N-acetylmuramoyl-L-alanine amidase [Firmicutes bacterium]|nr:N-acetylmuramoyl-L-alanine amidase [Bacillota bacterium]